MAKLVELQFWSKQLRTPHHCLRWWMTAMYWHFVTSKVKRQSLLHTSTSCFTHIRLCARPAFRTSWFTHVLLCASTALRTSCFMHVLLCARPALRTSWFAHVLLCLHPPQRPDVRTCCAALCPEGGRLLKIRRKVMRAWPWPLPAACTCMGQVGEKK